MVSFPAEPHTASRMAGLSVEAGLRPPRRVPGQTALMRSSVVRSSGRRAIGRSRPSDVMTRSTRPGPAIDLHSPQPMQSPFSTISARVKGGADIRPSGFGSAFKLLVHVLRIQLEHVIIVVEEVQSTVGTRPDELAPHRLKFGGGIFEYLGGGVKGDVVP